MLPKSVAATLGCVLTVMPAAAAELVSSEFQVTFQYGGAEQRLNDSVVPLLPGNVCYTWWMQFGDGVPPQEMVERLSLPEPLADWGDMASNPDDGVEISADSKVATSTFVPELDGEGWMSKGWCAAPGDPLGRHRIEVVADGTPLRTFDFEVVAPEDYAWPALPQPDPRERSVLNSW